MRQRLDKFLACKVVQHKIAGNRSRAKSFERYLVGRGVDVPYCLEVSESDLWMSLNEIVLKRHAPSQNDLRSGSVCLLMPFKRVNCLSNLLLAVEIIVSPAIVLAHLLCK